MYRGGRIEALCVNALILWWISLASLMIFMGYFYFGRILKILYVGIILYANDLEEEEEEKKISVENSSAIEK